MEARKYLTVDRCRHERKELNEEEYWTCWECGVVLEPDIRHDEKTMESVSWKTRRFSTNKYQHKTYAKNLIDSMMGQALPVNDPKHKSLLQTKQVPRVVALLRAELGTKSDLDPRDVVEALRRLRLGKLYRYRVFLCERLNPRFVFSPIDAWTRDSIIQQFNYFVRRWLVNRQDICKEFRIKRKSLPHVPSILAYIIEKRLHRPDLLVNITRMRSNRRQQKITKLIARCFGD
jgi:hypothetical protein